MILIEEPSKYIPNFVRGINDIKVYLESDKNENRREENKKYTLEAMKAMGNLFYSYPNTGVPTMKITLSSHVEGYMYHSFIDFDRKNMWE